MNTFKYGRVSVCEGHYREVPVSALGNIAINGWLDVVWHLRIGETRALEERAIERWENEGGEIPNEKQAHQCLRKLSPPAHPIPNNGGL